MKYSFLCCFLLFIGLASAQNKYEQEIRVSETEFPQAALELVAPYIQNAKRVRFYHETDGSKESYEVKFKKDRLRYSIEFDKEGQLEDVEFLININDIPEESWSTIWGYLKENHQKVHIKKIQQQYPVGSFNVDTVLKAAFQNLILEYINYEVVFTAKNKKGFQTYEALFSSNGSLVHLRKSFSPKYDHILY